MSDRKMSWLKFWPDDYQGSERVRLMTIAQDWAYFHLILHCARNGSVPASPEECAKLLGKGVRPKDVAVALSAFVPIEDEASRMAHPRVMRERAATFAKSEKNAESGKMGASAKHSRGERQANATPRALAQEAEAEADTKGNKTSLEASHVISAGDAACSTGEVSASPVSPPARWRPKTHAEAVAMCKAQMADAPEEFVKACFDRLESVGWLDTTGRNEVAHFAAYVRAAWRNQKQQDSDRAAGTPAPVDEALCEEVRAIWNEVAAKKGLTRSRVAPGVATKRAIGAAFAGFKRGDSPPGDEEAAKRFRLGTFRILFSALGEDPASNGTKGKPVDLEYAVSARGINYAAERANV